MLLGIILKEGDRTIGFALTCQSRRSFQGWVPSCGHPCSQRSWHTSGTCSRQLFEESSCQRELGGGEDTRGERGLCSCKDRVVNKGDPGSGPYLHECQGQSWSKMCIEREGKGMKTPWPSPLSPLLLFICWLPSSGTHPV